VSISLSRIADIEQANGDLDAALAKYEEGLAIARRLAEELGTPQSHRDVSISLGRIADIEQANGDLDGALAKYEEGLAIARRLAEELGTPESHRDVSFSLNRIALIQLTLGDPESALANWEECLAVSRSLAERLDTSQSRGDVSLILNNSIWATKLILDRLKPNDPVATSRIAASQTWVDQLEGFKGLTTGEADTLAAWWEHAAAIAQATGRTDDHAHAQAKARHWRDRERELRAAEPDQDGTPSNGPS